MTYQWATNTEPDFLVLQFDDAAVNSLFERRGFTPIVSTELDLRAANGCLLTRLDATTAEVLVTISAEVGASRIPVRGLPADWLARVVETGHAGILLTTDAVVGGAVTKDDLRRDVDAGAVLAALVPAADPDD